MHIVLYVFEVIELKSMVKTDLRPIFISLVARWSIGPSPSCYALGIHSLIKVESHSSIEGVSYLKWDKKDIIDYTGKPDTEDCYIRGLPDPEWML